GKFPKPIPIIELKQMLGLVDRKGKEQYTQISLVKEFVLDIAKRQINEETDISFDYELNKRGRTFKYTQNYVETYKNKPTQHEMNYKKNIEYQKSLRTVMTNDISEEQAKLILKDGYKKFVEFIEQVNKRARKGEIKVENATAYIIGSYQKKGVIPKKS